MQFITPKGAIFSYQSFTEWCKKSGLNTPEGLEHLEKSGWTTQKPNPKHRYVYILDKSDRELIARVEKMRKPYPKRGKQATAGNHSDSGGAAPTTTLQDQVF